MFTIHETSSDLITNGVIIKVRLCPPPLLKSPYEPIETYAEINTAIETTYIQEGISTSLGLEPLRTVRLTTATRQNYEANVYRLAIMFPQLEIGYQGQFYEVPYMPQPNRRIKCLIGRDVLRHFVLCYDGLKNEFSLEFKGSVKVVGG